MKAFLMHRDQDFDLQRELPSNEEALTQDLELNILFNAMALGDTFLFNVARRTLLLGLINPEDIIYRQHTLTDCIAQNSVVREIYTIAVEAIRDEKKIYFGLFRDSPEAILGRSLQVLKLFVGVLRRLRRVADEQAGNFQSEGFLRFFAMLVAELSDDYFQALEEHLQGLEFRRGVLMSAELGTGNKGVHYILRKTRDQGWMERLAGMNRSGYSFQIADRDESSARALSDLRGRGVNLVANALAQSTDHILSFFKMLRSELAFYIGCLNVHDQLTTKGAPLSLPTPLAAGTPVLAALGLYDASLALTIDTRPVGNDVNADGKSLVMITGANRGGKSTFLRSVGLAQLMMQCGMFVPARSFRANVCTGLFTHYKREEDNSMTSGKLDEELGRMSEIAEKISPHCILLCNESFASTNEREGSEIASQVIRALVQSEIKVLFVTHLFDLAQRFYLEGADSTLFLRAERQNDGRRSFKLIIGEPLPTSYGEDVYRRIFHPELSATPALSGV